MTNPVITLFKRKSAKTPLSISFPLLIIGAAFALKDSIAIALLPLWAKNIAVSIPVAFSFFLCLTGL